MIAFKFSPIDHQLFNWNISQPFRDFDKNLWIYYQWEYISWTKTSKINYKLWTKPSTWTWRLFHICSQVWWCSPVYRYRYQAESSVDHLRTPSLLTYELTINIAKGQKWLELIHMSNHEELTTSKRVLTCPLWSKIFTRWLYQSETRISSLWFTVT